MIKCAIQWLFLLNAGNTLIYLYMLLMNEHQFKTNKRSLGELVTVIKYWSFLIP